MLWPRMPFKSQDGARVREPSEFRTEDIHAIYSPLLGNFQKGSIFTWIDARTSQSFGQCPCVRRILCQEVRIQWGRICPGHGPIVSLSFSGLV